MAKAPAFQFYPSDFLRDLAEVHIDAVGAWAKCLCKMFYEPEQGRLTRTIDGFARLFGCDEEKLRSIFEDLYTCNVCNFEIDGVLYAVTERNANVTKINDQNATFFEHLVTQRNKKVTLVNRRMFGEWQDRNSNKIRQKRHREGQVTEVSRENNENVTPHSSSSSSSSLNTHSNAGEKTAFTYPLKPLIEAFPFLADRLTPGQAGKIESTVMPEDAVAWAATIETYQLNHDPAINRYMPDKVGNLLNVFRAERSKLENQNGNKITRTDKQHRNKNKDSGKDTAEYLASIGANPLD